MACGRGERLAEAQEICDDNEKEATRALLFDEFEHLAESRKIVVD